MIKDLQAFLAKVQGDKALQEKMLGIIQKSTQENLFADCNAVAAEMGYSITQDDVKAFADEHQAELSDGDLDKVAGGSALVFSTILGGTAILSVSITVFTPNPKDK